MVAEDADTAMLQVLKWETEKAGVGEPSKKAKIAMSLPDIVKQQAGAAASRVSADWDRRHAQSMQQMEAMVNHKTAAVEAKVTVEISTLRQDMKELKENKMSEKDLQSFREKKHIQMLYFKEFIKKRLKSRDFREKRRVHSTD